MEPTSHVRGVCKYYPCFYNMTFVTKCPKDIVYRVVGMVHMCMET